jgi:hypothetical protein
MAVAYLAGRFTHTDYIRVEGVLRRASAPSRNPTAPWIVQQMREAWPYMSAPKFLLFDHDAKFGREVVSAVRELGSEPVRTAYHSPWQNGVAERWVGSCRRDAGSRNRPQRATSETCHSSKSHAA